MRVSIDQSSTISSPPQGTRLRELFEQQVARTPHAVAVSHGGVEITYDVLNARSNQLARYLRTLGAGPGVCVALSLDRSPEMVASMLAIIKSGAAYVPLDAAYPAKRISQMLDASRASLLVTCKAHSSRYPDFRGRMVRVDEEWPPIDSMSEEDLSPVGCADDPTYVIFTSGSTGMPKGVVMPDRALVNLIWWHLYSPDAPEGYARTLQYAPISFDVSFQEIFSTWANGGTLVLVDEEMRRDPDALLSFIAHDGIERLFLPVVTLHQLAEAFDAGGPLPESLREVVTAGEALSVTESVVRLFESLGECELHNHYGPSETHVVTSHRLFGAPSKWPAFPPIGQPIWHATCRVLDENLQGVLVGEEGELYLSGEALAIGYTGSRELTDERFVIIDGERCYKTGDRVRDIGGGILEFLGRSDGQVKINGYRIETGEIEYALLGHPSLSGAAAVVRPDEDGENLLAAFVVGRPGAAVDDRSLRLHLRATLPEYMIPSQITWLDALPMTPTGKLDRKSLAGRSSDGAQPAVQLPLTVTGSLEEQIARAWSHVLPGGDRDWDTSFFDAGGNSVLMIKVYRKIQTELHSQFPITILFQYPTIRSLAKAIGQIQAQSLDGSNLAAGRQLRDSRAVLTNLKSHRRSRVA